MLRALASVAASLTLIGSAAAADVALSTCRTIRTRDLYGLPKCNGFRYHLAQLKIGLT